MSNLLGHTPEKVVNESDPRACFPTSFDDRKQKDNEMDNEMETTFDHFFVPLKKDAQERVQGH